MTKEPAPVDYSSMPTSLDLRTNMPSTLPYYEIVGAGTAKPWLVMVHGASQHMGLFSSQRGTFHGRFRLLLIDLPGHGNSSALSGPFGIHEYARSVLAVLTQANIKSPHFLGSHTGAAVGLMIAAQRLYQFQTMILEGAVVPGLSMPYVEATIDRAKRTALSLGIKAALAEWFCEAEWFNVIRTNPIICRSDQHWDMIAQFQGAPWLDTSAAQPVSFIGEQLAEISTPTLVINGERDVKDFMIVANELGNKLLRVERRVIPNAGGFPCWEYPDLTNQIVECFLSTHIER